MKRSALVVRAQVWGYVISSGRGKSYRQFPNLLAARDYAASKGYGGIQVKFC